ncbi:MAG: Hpt domain-containing protein [Microcystaceae cyanobacterium]
MDQHKILGYFIEEAKEHLETLERGILELSAVMDDSERLNEMFRAAHSIKGGAAMLGYSSIQKISHRLEDAFKILKDNRVAIDQKLESLFLKGYDVLQDLVEKLQSSMGLQPDEAESIVEGANNNFVELQHYLNYLLTQESAAPVGEAPSTIETEPDSERDLAAEIKVILRQMLPLFKGNVSPQSREQLQAQCSSLLKLSPQPNWQKLVHAATTAIANPVHSYPTLAPVVIKDLKQGCDYLELEQGQKITVSLGLQQLADAKVPYVLLPADPQKAASILLQLFNQQQIGQLVKGLSK